MVPCTILYKGLYREAMLSILGKCSSVKCFFYREISELKGRQRFIFGELHGMYLKACQKVYFFEFFGFS